MIGEAKDRGDGLTEVALDGGGLATSTDTATGRVAVSVHPWEITLEPAGPAHEGSAQTGEGPARERRGSARHPPSVDAGSSSSSSLALARRARRSRRASRMTRRPPAPVEYRASIQARRKQ